jgi:hypothetical protein
MGNLLQGKKTYLVMAVTIILAALESFSGMCETMTDAPGWCLSFDIPEWVYAILGGMGVYTRKVAKPS